MSEPSKSSWACFANPRPEFAEIHQGWGLCLLDAEVHGRLGCRHPSRRGDICLSNSATICPHTVPTGGVAYVLFIIISPCFADWGQNFSVDAKHSTQGAVTHGLSLLHSCSQLEGTAGLEPPCKPGQGMLDSQGLGENGIWKVKGRFAGTGLCGPKNLELKIIGARLELVME